MPPLICDASVAMSLVMQDEAPRFEDAVLEAVAGDQLHVPAVWPAEVLNGLRSNVLRKRLAAGSLADAAELVLKLSPIVAAPPPPADWVRWLVHLSHGEGCSAYDASYVLLAEALQATVATGDGNLRRVAERVGVPCLRLEDASA